MTYVRDDFPWRGGEKRRDKGEEPILPPKLMIRVESEVSFSFHFPRLRLMHRVD